MIDVYHIDDAIAFQDSSTGCVACGKDYCSEPDPGVVKLETNVLSIEHSPHTTGRVYSFISCPMSIIIVIVLLPWYCVLSIVASGVALAISDNMVSVVVILHLSV